MKKPSKTNKIINKKPAVRSNKPTLKSHPKRKCLCTTDPSPSLSPYLVDYLLQFFPFAELFTFVRINKKFYKQTTKQEEFKSVVAFRKENADVIESSCESTIGSSEFCGIFLRAYEKFNNNEGIINYLVDTLLKSQTELEIGRSFDVFKDKDFVLKILQRSRQLKVLNIATGLLEESLIIQIAEGIRISALETVKIESRDALSNFTLIYEQIHKMKDKLVELEIIHHPQPFDRFRFNMPIQLQLSFTRIPLYLEGLNKLTTLFLCGIILDQAPIDSFGRFIRTTTTLTDLTLQNVGLPFGTDVFFESFRWNKSIVSLAMNQMKAFKEAAVAKTFSIYLRDWMTIFKGNLEELTLHEIGMSTTCMAFLFEALQETNIKTLNFSKNNFLLNRIGFINKFITVNTNIKELVLQSCKIDKDCLTVLLQGLKSNKSIEILDLTDNKGVSRAKQEVEDCLTQCDNIKKLYVSNLKVGRGLQKFLNKRLFLEYN